MKQFDVCVIGAGGVVASAILRKLAERGLSTLGLEKHDGPAQETSGLNSRVIHSGFHETPGTLKSQLALAGSRMMAEYTTKAEVPTLQTGMLIAAPRGALRHGLWREGGALWHLWRNGRRHGVTFHWIATPAGIRKIAPVDAIGGIFIPSVFVVDVFKLIDCLQRDATRGGAHIQYSAVVQQIAKRSDYFVISTSSSEFAARALINSAGLAATQISEMAGGPRYSVKLLRGEYYELKGGIARWGIRTLVYPAMPSNSPSKGVHFGPRTDGRLFIGPNATDATDPPTSKAVFLQAAQKFLPRITDDDLTYSCAGVRPKYTAVNGLSDFRICLDNPNPALVNLIGIDSPGLSSSLAIAEYVSKLLPFEQNRK